MKRTWGLGWAVAWAGLGAACTPEPVAPSDPGPRQPEVEVVTHQEILTPLPMRVSLPARYGAERVVALYHTWGSHDWGMTELERSGQTWAGEVSCREVSTVTGDTRYFFLALDAEGKVVADSGSDWPFVATVVRKLRGGPQGLAGSAPPARCHDPADCPPDFPGCPHYAWLRPACVADEECATGRCEWDGYCAALSEFAENDVDAAAQFDAALKRASRQYRIAGMSHLGRSR